MKPLYRSAVTLTFITIIGVIVSILFFALRRLYIESWFFFDPSIMIGFLSGLVLTSLISLINFRQLQRNNAKELAAQLDGFQQATDSFQNLMVALPANQDVILVPQQYHPELEFVLARLDEHACNIMRCERVSPLKSTTIQRFKRFCSLLARTELSFYQVFSPLAESCSLAYRTQSILPYLKDETERIATQNDFNQNLRVVFESLQRGTVLDEQMRAYRVRLDRFLGARRATPQDASREA